MSNPIVSFDEQAVKDELRELARKTIEETINAMLDEEAYQLVGAGPHERTDERAAYRAGHYERGSTTTSGRVTLKMPKLKGMRFATAVIERYKAGDDIGQWARKAGIDPKQAERRESGERPRRQGSGAGVSPNANAGAGMPPAASPQRATRASADEQFPRGAFKPAVPRRADGRAPRHKNTRI